MRKDIILDPNHLASEAIKIWTNKDTTGEFENLKKTIARQMVYAPLSEGETAVIAWQTPKTAALCFDRVWTGQADHVPEGIRFFGGTMEECAVAMATVGSSSMARLGEPQFAHLDPKLREQLARLFNLMMHGGIEAISARERVRPGEQGFEAITRILSESINVPAYYNQTRQMLPYEPGRNDVILSTLVDLDIVDEHAISWEQVGEFRKDDEARKKYRRLVHWLDKDMVGKSAGYIRDEVGQRIEAYEWALKKHGITTVTGALSTVLEAKQLLLAAAAGVFVTKAADPFAGLCVAGGTLVAKTAIEITKSLLALNDTKLGAEIAFVHDVKERLTTR